LRTPSGRRTWLGSVRVGLHVRDQGTTTASVHVSVTILYLALSSEYWNSWVWLPRSGFSLNGVSTSSTKICVSFTFRCALIFVDTYAHTLFLEVNFSFSIGIRALYTLRRLIS
jgi:hypothetical protein